MSDQAAAKRTLQELIKRGDLNNKVCIDCGNPNPQWASLSFAVFLCLQCAGTHRGFGVHISFVRSVSMDTWQDEQVRRMKLGGNEPFRSFMKSYPADQGGYSDSLSVHDKYHCWAATQYREKLDADLAGRPWHPTPPSSNASTTSRPTSAQGLRKSRTGASRSNTTDSPFGTPSGTPPLSPKSANESYFASLGQANASRPEHLPPSQGGRYQGFGSTPSPSDPAQALSSRNAPTLSDLQEDPVRALNKGWSLLSSALSGFSSTVIQPGVERVMDPQFQAQMREYVSDAGRRAGEVGAVANRWGRDRFGVDVGAQVGSVASGFGAGMSRDHAGYDALAQGHDGESSALYQDRDEDDFFGEFNVGTQQQQQSQSKPAASGTSTTPAPKPKKDEWDDDWKDF